MRLEEEKEGYGKGTEKRIISRHGPRVRASVAMIPCQGCLLVVLSLLFLRLSAPSLHSGDLYENGIPVMEEEEKQRPGFLGGILNISVPKGKEAVLQCRVTNLGHFQVGWIQVDTQTILTIHTKVITHNNRISVSTGESGHLWNLHIRNIGEGDAGCYMCQINTLRMQKQTGCLDVHVPPDIVTEETSSDTTVSEGSDVTLACKAEGHPKPKVIWRREDSAPILVWDSDRLFSSKSPENSS
ncbi:unnamed protein product [Darwinula stevensoni]|uniref:Ig-like domain-containing protein n=1 Tax=Darwinula stevensoni TaxID=69355 RepID=A0A7R8X700_9CRUS|nr:unnamed protein product [Darwinula stevensoni]CAG0882033.1 unnamed protein product [Darwinula stevensoni]